MKFVRFEHEDKSIEVTVDRAGERPEVHLTVIGCDEVDDIREANIWLPAELAREFAAYLIEMADAAEPAPRPVVGSGYRPSAWCPNCHAPHAADISTCPECKQPRPAPGTCLDCGKPCTAGHCCDDCQEERRR